MTKTKLAKLTATAITGTALTLGALTIFNGTETIDLAKNTIENFAEKINIYESNETKLVNKINELKLERDELTLQLSEFEGIQLDEMNEQIETLENKIVEYETQLSNAEENAETLAGRILDLEAEVLKANNKSQELQTVIDENIVEDEPLTERELAEIAELEIEPEYIELTYNKNKGGRLTIIEGLQFYFSSPYYTLENLTGLEVSYQIENTGEVKTARHGSQYVDGISGSSTNLLVVTLSNGQTYRINVIQ